MPVAGFVVIAKYISLLCPNSLMCLDRIRLRTLKVAIPAIYVGYIVPPSYICFDFNSILY